MIPQSHTTASKNLSELLSKHPLNSFAVIMRCYVEPNLPRRTRSCDPSDGVSHILFVGLAQQYRFPCQRGRKLRIILITVMGVFMDLDRRSIGLRKRGPLADPTLLGPLDHADLFRILRRVKVFLA